MEDGPINPRPPAIGQVKRFSKKAIDRFSMTNRVKVNIEKGSEIKLLDLMRPEEVDAAMNDQKTHSTGGPDDVSVTGWRKIGALVEARRLMGHFQMVHGLEVAL